MTLKLPVKAVKRPFGDWMWFLDDANGKPVAQIMPSTDEAMARALADLINRPTTLEGRACGWVYDADHDYYTTECGEDIAFPEMDRKPPIGREWLRFCSGCGKKALLREAGRVK